ncbi:hypothetical protein OEZ86_012990 [Tetradesmus obliquus]|nr:hypothetical protein OEZ86_012990 [Tetradesmus obliquus]
MGSIILSKLEFLVGIVTGSTHGDVALASHAPYPLGLDSLNADRGCSGSLVGQDVCPLREQMAESHCLHHGSSLTGAKSHPYAWAKCSHRSKETQRENTSQTSCCGDASWAGDWSRQQLGQQQQQQQQQQQEQQQQEQQQLKQLAAAPAKALAAATAANGVGVALLQLQQNWQSPLRCPGAGVVTAQVQQQKRAAFLETALQLANNSLEATMHYLHSAHLLIQL